MSGPRFQAAGWWSACPEPLWSVIWAHGHLVPKPFQQLHDPRATRQRCALPWIEGTPLGWFNRLAQSKVCGMWPVVLIANSDLIIRIVLLEILSWVSKEPLDCRWLSYKWPHQTFPDWCSQYFTEHLSPTLSATVDGTRHTMESSSLESPRKKVLTLIKEWKEWLNIWKIHIYRGLLS